MDCEPSLVCSEEAMTSRISFEQEFAANFLVSVVAGRKEKSSPVSWPSSFQEHIWYFTRCANFVFPSTAYVFQEPFIT
jgi:hypothetical protein